MTEIRIKPQRRTALFVREEANEESRTVPLAFSSEEPVERWFGMEILGHNAGEAQLDWIASGRAPLLVDHRATDQVGVVVDAAIGSDRKGRAVVRFGRSSRAEEVFRDVLDGIRTNVSVGYEIAELTLLEKGQGVPDIYRATSWKPIEISLVSIPADQSVGVGRDDDGEARSVRVISPHPLKGRKTMTTNIEASPAAPAFDEAAERKKVADRELHRIREIQAISQRHQLAELGEKAIKEGMPLDSFRGLVLDELSRRSANPMQLEVPRTELGLSGKEKRSYSLLRAIRAQAEKNWDGAGLELEAHREIEKRIGQAKRGFYVPFEIQQRGMQGKRDLTVGTATAGGHLVATQNDAASFIELLRARAVVVGLGARTLTGLVGNVNIPRQSGSSTAYWLANEATAITEGDLTLGQLALTPKNVGAYTEISRLLTMQSAPDAEMLVMDDLASVVALAIDAAAISGSGSSGQPTGVIGTAGIGTVTGTSLAWAGIVEFETDVAAANALNGSLAYLTTPAVRGLLKTREKAANTGIFLWGGMVGDSTVNGYRGEVSTQVPAANMIFGDWSQIIIANWGVLEIETNPYANFAAGIIGVRAWATVDIGVRQAAAFSRAVSIT